MIFKKYHVSRNLLPSPVSATVESAGITIESTGDGTINVSGTRTSGNSPTINLKEAVTLNGTYYVHLRNNVAAPSSAIVLRNGTTSIVSITLTSANRIMQMTRSNVTIDNIQVYVASGININAQMTISIEQTESVTPYEPYSSEVWHDIPHYIHNTSTDTITTLPAVVYPNDTTATVGLKGQMEQSGTPTPATPIQPQECGEKTGNLFDAATAYGAMYSGGVITGEANAINDTKNKVTTDMIGKTYTISITPLRIASRAYMSITINGTTYWRENELTVNQRSSFQFTPVTENDQWFITYNIGGVCSYKDIMVNEGSEALPYEPYGYKIPISSASTTTPVYLGEVETMRKIKKMVLDGTENWLELDVYYTVSAPNVRPWSGCVCTHCAYEGIIGGNSNTRLWVKQASFPNYQTLADFKAYLAQQYANGTPVTVWYSTPTPETVILNEPLRKIGDYADEVSGITIPTIAGANTLSIGTALQPSEVSVNYKGWHPVADVHERDSGQWD